MLRKFKEFRYKLANIVFNDNLRPVESKPVDLFKDLYSLGQCLPYETYDSSTEIYHNAHSKGLVIECDPISGASDDDMDSFYALLQRVLPEGAIVQFLMYASPYVGGELDGYKQERMNAQPVIKKLAQRRVEYWKKGVYSPLIRGQQVVLRDFKVLVSLTLDNSLELSEPKILSLKTSLLGTLKSAGMFPRMVEPPKLIQWVRTLLFPDGSLYQPEFDWDELNSINGRVINSGYIQSIMPSKISVGDGDKEHYIRNFHVPQFGKFSPHLSEMSDLVGGVFDIYSQVGCPFSLSFVVQICNQAKEKKIVQAKALRAIQRAHMIGKISPKSIDEAHEARACVKKLEEFERLVLISFQASLYCKPEEIESHDADIKNVFQSMSRRWELKDNKLVQMPMMTSHLPMNQSLQAMKDLEKLGKTYKLWAKNAAGMLPILAETKGMDSKKIMIVGRRGQMFFFDPFRNPRGNYNTCVAGISGAGKSVTVQDMVCSLVGTGGRVFIIDVGRSYKKLCQLLNGQFVEFNYDNPICLNPFSTMNDEEEFVGFMVPFLCLMVNPNGDVLPIEVSFLSKAVKEVLKHKGSNGELNDIINWLLEQEDQRAKDIGNMLFPFGSDGQYGRYFNGKANTDFNNPIVVFELEEISGNKRFQSVIFSLLMHQVSEKMYLGGRKQNISLVIDEAWDMLKGGHGGSIIESVARRARKYKGSLITITQGLEDYFESPAAHAAYTNSYWKIIHMQNKENVETLVSDNKLVLNHFQKRLLCSVKTEHGVYSEMMIKGDGGEYACGRLLLDPYSRVLYSTQANDFARVNQFCSQGIPLEEAIEIVAKENFPDEMD